MVEDAHDREVGRVSIALAPKDKHSVASEQLTLSRWWRELLERPLSQCELGFRPL